MNVFCIGILVVVVVVVVVVVFFVCQVMIVEELQVVQIVQIEQCLVFCIFVVCCDINVGEWVSVSDFYWQFWLEEVVFVGYIVENCGQDVFDFVGVVVCVVICQGELVIGCCLVQQGDVGFMFVVFVLGMCVVVVLIFVVMGVGGFILFNDCVDVIVFFQW